VGFIEGGDGSLLVAAGDANADWARTLEMDPRCVVTIAERTGPYRAELVEGAARNAAVAELILRYGTPSERLGSGPVFRLIADAIDPAYDPASEAASGEPSTREGTS
jgi:hypothetical protein